MLNLLSYGLVIAGACVLAGALIPVRQLIALVPRGSVRRKWYVLTALIVLFVVGYLGYVAAFWNRHMVWLDLIVPGVFFFGAVFVWLTVTLSLQTASDVRRVTLLEQENITDHLTGIYNRRYLERRIEEESVRVRRYSLPLAVLLIDIDHFKHINDIYGHQAGDQVLSHLGKLLLETIRTSDIAARYGGEEMLVIATNTTPASAGILAERIRQLVETHEIVLTSGSHQSRAIRITVSIGVAGISQEATDSQKLVHNADEALYHAKQKGRNRIVIHDANQQKFTSPNG